ncbi:hypothetical protein 035JT001_84 [Bacillus phage 035JT001]|nr:hypothetical protein 035JT001_84 [Bacillus phage 035JT001]
MTKRRNGYYTAKDKTHYIMADRVFKKGYVTGFKYHIIDGREVIDLTPLKITFEELDTLYDKGLKL